MSGVGTIDAARQVAQGLARALLPQAGGTGRIDARALGLIAPALNDSGGSLAAGALVCIGGSHTVLGNIAKVTLPGVRSLVIGVVLDPIANYTKGDILTLGLHPAVLSTGTIAVGDLLYPSATAGYCTATPAFGSVPLGYALTTASGTSTVAVWFDPTPAGFSLYHSLLQGVQGLNRHANLNEGAGTYSAHTISSGTTDDMRDRSDSTALVIGGTAPHVIQAQYPFAAKATAARLYLRRSQSGSGTQVLAGCTIDASNDGSSWTNLWTGSLSATNLGAANPYENLLAWAAPAAYTYYRVLFPASLGDDMQVFDWALYEAAGQALYVNSGATSALLDTVLAAASSNGGFIVTPPTTIPLPPRVVPTGSGFITANAAGRQNVDTSAGYKAFVTKVYRDGRWHMVYRQGTDHFTTGDGDLMYRYSDDDEKTWSAAVVLVAHSAGHDVRDPSITALSNGRLLVGYDDRLTSGGVYCTLKVIHSDNGGQSWSSAYSAPASGMAYEAAGTSPGVQLPINGNVLLPIFGAQLSTDFLFAAVLISADGGLTFPTQVTIASSGSRHFAEPTLVQLSSGELVCFMHDASTTIYRSVSIDGGQTWSAATAVLTAVGRTDVVEIWPGVLFMSCRDSGANGYQRVTTSWDKGVTWGALQNVDGATDLNMYAALGVPALGTVTMVYSLEINSTTAHLYSREYHDGYGIDPLGNVTALSVAGGPTMTIKDEGTPLATAATSLDFVGAGVTATGAGAAKTITIPGVAAALDDLTDVVITTPVAAQFLRYSGSVWVNAALVVADYPYHDEVLCDSAGPILDSHGDVVMVTGVPN